MSDPTNHGPQKRPAFDRQKIFPKIFPVCLISYLTIKALPIYLLHAQQGNNKTQTGDKNDDRNSS